MAKTLDRDALTSKALKSALKLASKTAWTDVTLRDIAEEAGIDLEAFYGQIDKSSVLDALDVWADKAMSEDAPDMKDTPRERLFDAIMLRFERLETQRAGALSMLAGRSRQPGDFAHRLRQRRKTAKWAMVAAGLDSGAPVALGAMRVGLIRAISKAEAAWREDDSGDFARTMATLDGELINIEERLDQLSRLRKRFRRWPNMAASSRPEGPQAETSEA
ncbi:MAG: hypothetical protein AAGJ53_10225 [Pseudomonadota bacterium]